MATVRQNDFQHAQNHWDSKYEGPSGAVAESHARYVEAVGNNARYVSALVGYLSTLFAAHNSQLAQFYKFWRLHRVFWYRKELKRVVVQLFKEYDFRSKLSPSDKDVLMAVLNLLRRERDLAVELGYELISNKATPLGIKCLATARMSRMKGVPQVKRDEYRCRTRYVVKDLYHQRELGWKTINRLARMINERKMVWTSASMDWSPDILKKSIAWQLTRIFFLV